MHQVVHGFCDAPTCRLAVGQRRVAQRQAEELAAIRATAATYREESLEKNPLLRARGVEVLVVPGFEATMQPMPRPRRDTLRAHIAELLSDEATDGQVSDSQLEEISPQAQQVASAGCMTCRGYCCRKGGDSAYIKADTIKRVRRTHPELDFDALIGVYLNAVPESSAADSCIFHGERGCTLPRAFRADICNQYFCPALRSWFDEPHRAPDVAVAMIVVSDATVVRSTLLD